MNQMTQTQAMELVKAQMADTARIESMKECGYTDKKDRKKPILDEKTKSVSFEMVTTYKDDKGKEKEFTKLPMGGNPLTISAAISDCDITIIQINQKYTSSVDNAKKERDEDLSATTALKAEIEAFITNGEDVTQEEPTT